MGIWIGANQIRSFVSIRASTRERRFFWQGKILGVEVRVKQPLNHWLILVFGALLGENCFKQGLLLIELPARTVEQLAELVTAGEFTVSLEAEVIETPTRARIGFNVNSWRRRSLLEGLDAIDLSLTLIDQIEEFTRRDKAKRPWVYSAGAS